MTTTMTAADPGTELGTLLTRVSGACLLGAGAIHLAGAPVHTGHDASIGAFFWVVGVAQLVLGLGLLLQGGRRMALVAGASSAAVVALWVVSRTVGVAGLSTPAAAEGVEVADAVATGLEVAVILMVLGLLRPALRSRWIAPGRGQVTMAALAMVVGAVAAPAALAAPDQGGGADHHGGGAGEQASADQDGGGDEADHHGGQPAADHPDADHPDADHPDASQAAGGGEHESTAFVFGEESHQSAEPCDPTGEEQAAADRLLAHTKDGLARLSDIDVARNEGYMRYGDVAISGTWHYINWEYQADTDVLDPTKPESIVYWQSGPDAPMILIGAMYVMPTVDDLGPQVGGCLTRWHTHGEPFAPNGALTNEMLHVWTVPLPNGPFV